MEQPLVSIVTITRNRGNMLKRCIESVLSQTYYNIEHIVVDGASDDNTDEVIDGIKDERLKFHKLDYNWPLHETSAFAYSLCNGKYITFLDSDDEYLPTKIEKEVNLIESLPEDYGFVYCWMTYYDSSRNAFDHLHNPQLRGFVKDEVVVEPIITGTPTLLFRLDFFRSFGGWKSRDEIGIASDWEMCARACQQSKVDYVPESLVNVYVNHGSERQSDNSNYNKEACKRLLKFHHHFLSQFSENFKRHPESAYYHFYFISLYNYKLHNYREGFKFLIKAFLSNPNATIRRIIKKNDK